jgi:methylated-DNA-[protein]-cysteine S-methyltransferase
MTICYVDSPVGRLAIEADHDAVTGVRWASPGERTRERANSPVLKEAAHQLNRYFAKKLKRFDLPLAQRGTDFQKRVWAMMRDIPYGETATYGGMAVALGSGPRPIGMACARNPIPIIVPCHRVLGSGGSEGGFSGGKGLPTKRQLLAIEGVILLHTPVIPSGAKRSRGTSSFDARTRKGPSAPLRSGRDDGMALRPLTTPATETACAS